MTKKIALALVLVLLAAVSAFYLSDFYSSEENREATISQIDENITTVTKLSAGSAAASALISAIPGDTCTPIANEIAELSKYFLIVLSSLYLERYLVTITGTVSFGILIPIACLFFIIFVFWRKKWVHDAAVKLAAFALAIWLVIPASVHFSDAIYQMQASSVENALETSEELETYAEEEESGGIIASLLGTAEDIKDYASNSLTQFLKSLSIMIVTACVIPILVILAFIWIFKLLFGGSLVRIVYPDRNPEEVAVE